MNLGLVAQSPTRWLPDRVSQDHHKLSGLEPAGGVGPEIYPNHGMLPLQANMSWADAGDDLKSIWNLWFT